MRKEDFIKLGLAEADAEKCASAYEAQKADVGENYISKKRFNEVNAEKKELRAEVEKLTEQLAALGTAEESVQQLKAQLAQMQAESQTANEAHVNEVNALRIANALDVTISQMRGRNSVAIKALLDMGKIAVDENGNVTGHQDQLQALAAAADSSFMFKAKKSPEFKGATVGESGNDAADKPFDMQSATFEETCAYLRENPNATLI